MYAIIKTGGKQYRVAIGEVIDVELVDGEIGSEVQFTDVLFVNNGSKPVVGGAFCAGMCCHRRIDRLRCWAQNNKYKIYSR